MPQLIMNRDYAFSLNNAAPNNCVAFIQDTTTIVSYYLLINNNNETFSMSELTFKYTILYVKDVADTLTFFETAFGFKRAMLHESGDYGELDTGDTTLSFSSLALMSTLGKNPSKVDSKSPAFELAFQTDDVAGALEKAIDAGATLVQQVEEMPWGQTTAYVSDNNGFLIELCSPISGQS